MDIPENHRRSGEAAAMALRATCSGMTTHTLGIVARIWPPPRKAISNTVDADGVGGWKRRTLGLPGL